MAAWVGGVIGLGILVVGFVVFNVILHGRDKMIISVKINWWRRWFPAKSKIPCGHPAIGDHYWLVDPAAGFGWCDYCGIMSYEL